MCRCTRQGRGTLGSVRARVSSKLYDLGVDRCGLMIAGHGDAVVAIPHEVPIADLVEAHCRQLISSVVGAVYAAPPVDHAFLEGQE